MLWLLLITFWNICSSSRLLVRSFVRLGFVYSSKRKKVKQKIRNKRKSCHYFAFTILSYLIILLNRHGVQCNVWKQFNPLFLVKPYFGTALWMLSVHNPFFFWCISIVRVPPNPLASPLIQFNSIYMFPRTRSRCTVTTLHWYFSFYKIHKTEWALQQGVYYYC